MKKSLIISFMLIVILMFSGCSVKKNKKVDKATQQKNITKIQNDVSIIMGKNYEYVMDNMGNPYMTTYYINTQSYKGLGFLKKEGILKNLNFEMIYPKDVHESSALYVGISKDKVISVESDEFIEKDMNLKDLCEEAKSVDLVINFYNNRDFIDCNKVDLKSKKSYIGKNIDNVIVGKSLDTPNATSYSKDTQEAINYYILKEKNNNSTFIVSVSKDNGNILDIIQVSSVALIKELINMSN